MDVAFSGRQFGSLRQKPTTTTKKTTATLLDAVAHHIFNRKGAGPVLPRWANIGLVTLGPCWPLSRTTHDVGPSAGQRPET
ncbi:hypothetical protein CHARACLAT_000012 [Characodon lateralis]|uniref:Uncharacterized protein n=1 Tax=Characodon lateralis TaxID=208331 RepID=A0ABU7CXC9_9TELE|nr:hypothetical protein [Characodon lateralis]